jgi:hypothetical protein
MNSTHQPDQQFAAEILAMAQSDQEMRNRWPETKQGDELIDQNNTARLKQIIAAIGWPTKSKVGERAAGAAWLLVQHADHDPTFQIACIKLMQQEPSGEIDSRNIAYLEDRIRVNIGKPTLYGTQFYKDAKGHFGPRQIEDLDNLAQRRKDMGLEPFEEYEQKMIEIQATMDKKEKALKKDNI